ncbi:MAG: winged helix-turn-helix transcriptional regulator [Oscillospiraceae bacterium]|nr:winged helix-turn-helix transcriptional regulator [Oscillospiraceae bacterium]
MLSKDNKLKRMIEVAHLYYEEGKSQNEIAKELGISRPLVSVILSEAKEQGIVTITINDTRISAEQIADRIKNIYKISEITIVPDGENDGITNTKVAEVAFNQYFSRANDGKRVGIGWGVMVGKMADYASTLANASRTNGAIFPLAGGINSMTRDYHLNELVRIFSLKTGRTPYLLYAPALHDNPIEYAIAKKTEAYINIKEEWEYMEQALVTISNFPSYPDLAVKSLYGNALTEKKAVGWMLAHYFDSYGRIISPAVEATLQASVKQLKTTDVTAVCSNQIKPQCVIGALRTGIIDRLIIPLSLAEKVSPAAF